MSKRRSSRSKMWRSSSSGGGCAATNGTISTSHKLSNVAEKNEDGLALVTEEFLKCPVCNEDFNNPKVLPCLHSFCADCFKASLRQSNIGMFKMGGFIQF